MMRNKNTSTRHARALMMACLLVALVGLAGVYYWHARSQDSIANVHKPIAIVISGDTHGWIMPCGCTANQSGGLLRRATYLKTLSETYDVLYLDVGGSATGVARYDAMKLQAVLKGDALMGIAVHNVGDPEAALGKESLEKLATGVGIEFLSANLRDLSGNRIFPPAKIVTMGKTRIAIVGVTSKRSAGPSQKVDDPKTAILETLADIRGKFDSLVVLAYLPETELRQLAAELPEADIVAGGPTGQAILPTRIGPTLLTAATNKGKFLAELHRAESSWSGKIVEISAEIPDEAGQQANLRNFHDQLAHLDLSANDTSFVSTNLAFAPAGYQIAGTESCRACHATDCTGWKQTKHAAAWETLKAKSIHFDSYCQQCHTTGYGMPGGFQSVKQSPGRIAVGCESCHGPSKQHNLNPKIRTPFAAKDQCIRCHDLENSPTFAYDKFWPKIVHGDTKERSSTPAPPKGNSR